MSEINERAIFAAAAKLWSLHYPTIEWPPKAWVLRNGYERRALEILEAAEEYR